VFRPPPLPRTLDAALRDLADPKPEVRVDAIADLQAHVPAHRAAALAALDQALRDAAPRVRAAAARVLGESEARELLPALLIACEDDDEAVRQEAIAALGEVGDPRACGKLERALGDARPEVRFQAVMAYPRVCAVPGDVLQALVRATEDTDEHVVHVALRMAEEIAGRPPPTAAGSDATGAALESAPEDEAFDDEDEGPSNIDPVLLARARALLTHAAPRVRAVAAVILARSNDPAGDAVLLGVADGAVATPEAEDIASAITLAGTRGLRRAIPALERRAFGGVLGFGRDPWAWHARTALARMGHARASREILRELEVRDRTRRTLAVVAAGRARLLAARAPLDRLRASGDIDASLVGRALAALDRAAGTAATAPAPAKTGPETPGGAP